MTSESDKTCSTCKFWEQHITAEESDQGDCRRYPPVLDVLALMRTNKTDRGDFACESMLWWSQPVTINDNWCGEYISLKSP